MSTDTATFTRTWGPDETEIAGDYALFELTSSYRGPVNSEGYVPVMEVTYYVRHYEAPANLGDRCPPEGLWSVEEIDHSFYVKADDEDFDTITGEEYQYEGGSALWYWSLESAIAACREFAAEDESWKLTPWGEL